jgi:hypothetical protein
MRAVIVFDIDSAILDPGSTSRLDERKLDG